MTEPTCTIVQEAISNNMYPQGSVYHWRDGWYFCRGEGLCVHVWNDEHEVALQIPRDEWESIVNALTCRKRS